MTDELKPRSVEARHDVEPVSAYAEGHSLIARCRAAWSKPVLPPIIHARNKYVDPTEYKKPVLADRPCYITSHTFSDGNTISACLGIKDGRRCRYATGQTNTRLNHRRHSFGTVVLDEPDDEETDGSDVLEVGEEPSVVAGAEPPEVVFVDGDDEKESVGVLEDEAEEEEGDE